MQAVAMGVDLARQLRAAERRLLQLPLFEKHQRLIGDGQRGSARKQLDELDEAIDKSERLLQ
jgi:hypothetical protein